LDEAVAAYRRGVERLPEVSAGYSSLLLTLHYLPGLPEGTIAKERRRWNLQIGEPLRKTILPHPNDRNPNRRLRVGYVSPNFCEHVAGQNLRPLFRYHDHREFDVFCYSGVTQPDSLTEEFRQHADHWRSTIGVSDEAVARMIREDGVDILVDLALHTAGNRLPVFARQPAPVQVSFAGYPESTGLEAIQYRISDRWLEACASEFEDRRSEIGPSGESELRLPHSELRAAERVLLIDSFWCFDARGAEVGVNGLPPRESGGATFGSLASFFKINDSVLRLWARILTQTKDSRLVLLSGVGNHRQRTVDFLAREGVTENRVKFVERHPRRGYLELYHRLDIGLDAFPYGGHSTSLDALWMGVPVVSLAGQAPVSRAGLSIMSNLGLPELVAYTEDDYVRIATELAGDLPRLSDLRANLRSRMENSVLTDAPRFARQIEAAYRAMWRAWSGERK
jgi:predicted O-linked N-acetylglucosamine transferase (SPINDLY family)